MKSSWGSLLSRVRQPPPPPPPQLSDGPGQEASATKERHPLGKVLSGWGSLTTARPSGGNRGCQSRSRGEPDFRVVGWGGTSGWEPGVAVYEWDSPTGLSMAFTVARGLVDQQGFTLEVS